jgi:hypothetical protein
MLNNYMVPVLVNSFYGGSHDHWFMHDDFMDGMWKDISAGNGDWTVLAPDGSYIADNIQDGWRKWHAKPAAERAPGHYLVKGKPSSPAGPPSPPPGTLILRVTERNLKRLPSGNYSTLSARDVPILDQLIQASPHVVASSWNVAYNDSFRDVAWILPEEWQALLPAKPVVGLTFPVPEGLKKRLLLWHFVNRTFCVGLCWNAQDIRSDDLTVTVEETVPRLRLRLQGKVLLGVDGSEQDKKTNAERGHPHSYEPSVLGFIEYDPKESKFTRFDVNAIGDWAGGDWEGARFNVGKLPLAITFELPTNDPLASAILPCGGVALDSYLRAGSQPGR